MRRRLSIGGRYGWGPFPFNVGLNVEVTEEDHQRWEETQLYPADGVREVAADGDGIAGARQNQEKLNLIKPMQNPHFPHLRNHNEP